MGSALPAGEPVPAGGPLADRDLAAGGMAPLGIYIHVPFCATRCGYCDFNTYLPRELSGADPASYLDAAGLEIALAARSLEASRPAARSVFLGGGTPTLLAPGQLGRLLDGVREHFPLTPDAEITVEANPETVGPVEFDALLAAGVTRLSLGMQSAVPHVLATLERVHTSGAAVIAARQAAAAGFAQVSLDLIYGAPGESAADWQVSLDAVLSARPTHVSAYALVVEEGTRLARQVARGELRPPDDDILADRYEAADAAFTAVGLSWYEVSNWGDPCRHNLGYWQGGDWWGIGPGAHSHVQGVRWWNVRHPAGYVAALQSGRSPAAGREVLSADQRESERILLGVRLVDGLPAAGLDPAAVTRLGADGLLLATGERVRLTLRGRLLADAVVRELVA